MSRVRTALDGLESESHPDDATVAALDTDIDSAVDYMFANCQLPPEPDVALHAVLARLMANTSALKEDPSDGSDRKSVVAGKRVSVRVELGGRRIIEKKKRDTT